MTARMPELSRPHRGYRHTLDSALDTLRDLGVDPSRISVSMAGRGWPERAVIGQEPEPGVLLTPDIRIRLVVSGAGSFHDLPVGMWDKGTESQPGTSQIVSLFDDPLQKAGHWIRKGARLFDVRPGNLASCSRWIALFGFHAEHWPVDARYRLAVLLSSLHASAGKQSGVELALDLLLNLPLREIRRKRNTARLPEEDRSLLAQHHGKLGIDLVLSDRREAPSRWIVVIGPVSLSRYYHFQQPVAQQQLRFVLELTLPMYQEYEVQWTVLDPDAPIQLGTAEGNSILGVNSYFGAKQAAGYAAGTRHE